MSTNEPATITREQLFGKLEDTSPNHEDPRVGFALVNVLGAEAFERERIPGSIHIPADDLRTFDERFDKGKEIIVYCASPSCEASAKAARELTRRGFRRIVDYEGGLSDWKEAGNPITGGAR